MYNMIEHEIFCIAGKVISFIITTFCVYFICIAISKRLRRWERKIDDLNRIVYADLDRYSFIYLELLKRMRDDFISRDEFEAAMKIQKAINDELEKIKSK